MNLNERNKSLKSKRELLKKKKPLAGTKPLAGSRAAGGNQPHTMAQRGGHPAERVAEEALKLSRSNLSEKATLASYNDKLLTGEIKEKGEANVMEVTPMRLNTNKSIKTLANDILLGVSNASLSSAHYPLTNTAKEINEKIGDIGIEITESGRVKTTTESKALKAYGQANEERVRDLANANKETDRYALRAVKNAQQGRDSSGRRVFDPSTKAVARGLNDSGTVYNKVTGKYLKDNIADLGRDIKAIPRNVKNSIEEFKNDVSNYKFTGNLTDEESAPISKPANAPKTLLQASRGMQDRLSGDINKSINNIIDTPARLYNEFTPDSKFKTETATYKNALIDNKIANNAKASTAYNIGSNLLTIGKGAVLGTGTQLAGNAAGNVFEKQTGIKGSAQAISDATRVGIDTKFGGVGGAIGGIAGVALNKRAEQQYRQNDIYGSTQSSIMSGLVEGAGIGARGGVSGMLIGGAVGAVYGATIGSPYTRSTGKFLDGYQRQSPQMQEAIRQLTPAVNQQTGQENK